MERIDEYVAWLTEHGGDLSGRTPEEVERVRAEILATKKDDVIRFAETLSDIAKASSTCVVGGKKPLSACQLATTESVTAER